MSTVLRVTAALYDIPVCPMPLSGMERLLPGLVSRRTSKSVSIIPAPKLALFVSLIAGAVTPSVEEGSSNQWTVTTKSSFEALTIQCLKLGPLQRSLKPGRSVTIFLTSVSYVRHSNQSTLMSQSLNELGDREPGHNTDYEAGDQLAEVRAPMLAE